MKKVHIRISGMHCVSCAMNIDGELEDTEGVKSSSTNYAKQQTQVEFDSSQIDIQTILNIIGKLGYTGHITSSYS